MFPLPKGKPEFSKLEEAILQKWKAEKTFEKSVDSRPANNPYRFYDGPPFITGNPHYGTLLSSIIKDAIPRYQTMLGKRVERIWGWDCHGMPIEQKVQAKLGLESNKAIEESEGGIQRFIDECYNYTSSTSVEWNWYIDHIGRWVDMEHAYRTMDQDYMESVMWVFKQIWEKGYVYEGKRVSWYSWKLSTPISNFEIAMDDSYQDVQDPAVTIKFPINNVRKGAGIIIQDEEGKLLMIKNKKDGLWRFPGGNAEPGETYHTCAARELHEETEITCELTPYCSTYIGYRGLFYEALSFRGVVPVGHKVILEEDKFSDYEYFSLDALPVHSEIHRMEHDLIDFLTGVREPVIVPEIPEARKVNILAWTTTPWTLPMHMALAVNRDLQYVSVYHAEEIYIVAASRVETVFKGKGDYQVLGTIPGEELIGLSYKPPFDYYLDKTPFLKGDGDTAGTEGDLSDNKSSASSVDTSFKKEVSDKNFKIYHADFVTDTDGTGIAHEAPEFGDVDFQLAKQEGIHITSAIDEAGKYTAEVPEYQGQLYIDAIDPICERLKSERTLFKKESITHRVPYCPRSNTPLMQRAQKSWFIDIQRIKGELIEQNENINWFPDHFKHGRFLKSLESAPDWCISRTRFWGTPMPIWQNTDGSERVVIGSREELYHANKPLGQITKIICARHGESEANVAEVYEDVGVSPLTEKGKKQAEALAEKLSSEGVEVILSSPFVRAVQTVEPIAKKLGITIQTLEALRELNHGNFANQKNDGDSRDSRNAFRANPEVKFGETGESKNDIRNRVRELIEIIRRDYIGKTVLVMSHGFPIEELLYELGHEKMPDKFTNATPWTVYMGPNGKEINLHRPTIDGIVLPSQKEYKVQSTKHKEGITKFIFVRHGESTGNFENFMAKSDTPLTKEGEKQAQELSTQFQNTDIDIIISSPFLRARDTIAPLAKKLNKEVILDSRVREWDSGEFAGTSIYDERTAEILSKADNDPTVTRGRGECMNQLLERGRDFIHDMQKQYPGKTILVGSHNGFMRVLFSMLKEDQNWLQKKFENCEVATIYLDNNTGKAVDLSTSTRDDIVSPREKVQDEIKTTKVVLLRHAQTDFNTENRCDNSNVTTFTELGEKQREELQKTLPSLKVDTVYSSPMKRCLNTIGHIYLDNIRITEDLSEVRIGTFDNQIFSPESWVEYYNNPQKKLGETGESFEELSLRVKTIFQQIIRDNPGKTVLIATHGSIINVLREYIGECSFLDGELKSPVPNASLMVYFVNNDTYKSIPLLTRIPEVLDVWMDSASMPYAQVHYPFENVEKMEASFPADFIAEYTGQIRAWFYVMHVLGVLVKGSPAFKNVAVTGVINGTDGRKMSKSYGNYPDPKATIEQYGADALRFYLMGGPIMRGEDMNFSETGITESLKKVLLPLWNSYTFFATYANIDGWKPDGTEVWFTRHGKSEANEEGVMSGAENNSELSQKGREQVSVLQQHVAQQKAFDTIICSPRKRTVDTISGLGDYILDADFMEQQSGEFDGMKLVEIGEQIGTHDVSRIRDAYRWNKVEPWDVFYAKISGAIERVIAENKGKKILFCAHAGVFRAFTQYFADLHNRDIFYGSGIKNACLYRFPKTPKTHELDTWIISQLHNLIADTRKHMDNYDTQKACDGFVTFLDGLNNWYIRRNRRRFWRKEVDADKCSAYETLHEVLTTVCQLLAPICPFITEYLYQNLTGSHSDSNSHRKDFEMKLSGEISHNSKTNSTLGLGLVSGTGPSSVHLTYFPEANPLLLNLTVNQKMRDLQNLTNLGLAIRGREKLRVRQPLRSASITLDLDESSRATLAEELNVKEIHTISDIAEYVTITYSPDAKQIGATERKQWMKTIIADAKAGKGVLTPDGNLEITLPEAPDGKIVLAADEFETVYTPREGSTIAFVGNAGYVIGLDTTLDEALTLEGYSRDLIRAIQDARKELGFQVTDRLQLSLSSGNSILTGILIAHKPLIEAETLCTIAEVSQGESPKTVELDEGISVEIGLSK